MKWVVEVKEASVSVDGLPLHYYKAGRGPALVLVHGLVGSSRNWEQNIAFLARHRTVYALDLVNMGTSGQLPGLDPGLEASADRLALSMTALGVERADIGGHSHGGAIALMMAARHPERVRRLVLFAPANPYCDLGRHLIRFYQTRAGIGFARLLPRLPRLLQKTALSRMYGDPSRIHEGALDGYTACLNPGTVEHLLGIVRNWTKDMQSLRGVLREVAHLPTLLIWGDKDRAVGLKSGERLAKKLGAKLVVIPGVGHLPFAETPDICNEALAEWLSA